MASEKKKDSQGNVCDLIVIPDEKNGLTKDMTNADVAVWVRENVKRSYVWYHYVPTTGELSFKF